MSLKPKVWFSSALALALVAIGYVAVGPMLMPARGLNPVIPLQDANMSELPLLDVTLRDPALAQLKPTDAIDATSMAEEIKQFESDLNRSRGLRAVELHEQAYESYVALAYYFEDVKSGRIQHRMNRSKIPGNVATLRRNIIRHAASFAQGTKNEKAKWRAIYHINTARYRLGGEKRRAIANLRKVVKADSVDPRLRRRAKFLTSSYLVDYGNRTQRAKGTKDLISVIRGLPVKGSIAARLMVARGLGQINVNGYRVGEAKKRYRNFLWAASARAPHLSEREKRDVFRYAITIWRKVEGGDGTWRKAPLKMAAFSGLQGPKALKERIALEFWRSDREAASIAVYESLGEKFTGTTLKEKLDRRALALQRARYRTDNTATAYEKALLEAHETYLDPSVLGDGRGQQVEKMAHHIRSRHHAFVQRELGKAERSQASKSMRRRVIGYARNFLRFTDNEKTMEKTEARIAGLYAQNENHSEAVSIYQRIARSNVTGKREEYLRKAVASQSVIAEWPVKPPWGDGMPKAASGREKLLSLYDRWAQASSKSPDWFLLAQRGFLKMSLGRGEEAFTLWRQGLEAQPSGKHANRAAGFMLLAYKKSARWADLESLARFCRAKSTRPFHEGSRVDVRAMLALSLLEGGKKHLHAEQYATAVKKLEEFVHDFSGAKRHDEGHFLLASAYRGNAQYRRSIETLVVFKKKHEGSKYYKQALWNGGTWSVPMAFEENAMSFFAKFLERFPDASRAPQVRTKVTKLYRGRGLYDQALSVLKERAERSPQGQGKVSLWQEIIAIERKYGSMERAASMARKITSSDFASERERAIAYDALISFRASRDEMSKIGRIEGDLATYSRQSQAVRDALGRARFLLAKSKTQDSVKDYFNLTLKDPLGALNKQYDRFRRTKKRFQSVCEVGETAYCAPALHELAQMSERFLKSLEEIQIQEKLAKKVVSRFRNRKDEILNAMTSTSQEADKNAIATVSRGYTNPDWTSEVLWKSSSDWNFERVSGETGNGYVQWTAATASP